MTVLMFPELNYDQFLNEDIIDIFMSHSTHRSYLKYIYKHTVIIKTNKQITFIYEHFLYFFYLSLKHFAVIPLK